MFQAPNTTENFPYPQWTKEIDKIALNIMQKPGKTKPYSNSITDLLRFIRNLDEHPDTRISNRIGDHAEYFLKLFPALTIYVYNSLRQNPKYSHFADIQDPSL